VRVTLRARARDEDADFMANLSAAIVFIARADSPRASCCSSLRSDARRYFSINSPDTCSVYRNGHRSKFQFLRVSRAGWQALMEHQSPIKTETY